MAPNKVLIITYYWPPSGGPGVQRWLKFAKYLPASGITPVILTVKPEYAEYPIIDASLEEDISPDLEVHRTRCKGIYAGYKKMTGVKTAPYSGFANEGRPTAIQKIARFIRGNFFLPDARRGWIKYAFREADRLIVQQDIKIVITTGPPHSTHLTGWKLKRKHDGIRWIADFRDPWSNIQYKSLLYQTRWAQRIDLLYERRVLEHCDCLMMAVDERSRLEEIHPGADREKMVFMPNGYDETDFEGKQATVPDRLVITYTGTVAVNYPVEGILQALSLMDDLPFTLRFVGKVDEKTQDMFHRPLAGKVEFIPFVPHGVSVDYLMSSSVLLLINANVAGSQLLLHGKIFEYLASGKPILLLGAPDGKAARIIREAKAGDAFDYHDVEGIKNFLTEQHRRCVAHLPFVPDQTRIRQFSRKKLTEKLAGMIKQGL
jgi:hypothetical protein